MLKYTDDYIDPSSLVKEESTDGRLWAKSFMDQIKEGYFTKDEIDEGLMISWFANAIVTAEDKINRVNRANTKHIKKKQKEKYITENIIKELFWLCGNRTNGKPYEMVMNIDNNKNEWDQGKVHRWIGYAQCLLVAEGAVTLDNLKLSIKRINNTAKELYDN